jgi:hypothetical protein
MQMDRPKESRASVHHHTAATPRRLTHTCFFKADMRLTFVCCVPSDLQLEVTAWVNNSWETQWISGHASTDVGRLEVQVGGRL